MLQIKDIRKEYRTGDFVQTALAGVNLTLRDNEFVAILGPSGSGKTTLLNIIGGLDRYDSGDLIISGVSTKEYTDRDWDAYRNHTIGFVFQSYNLIPHQNVLSNVELALTLSGVSKAERRQRAKEALIKVGLGDHIHKKPNQMSGGQMQRVAIARALVNNPEIILADEPTGALDSETSIQVMDLLKEVAKDRLVVMVTHNPELAEEYANRIVRVKDGHIIADTNPVEPTEIVLTNTRPKRTKLAFTTALGLSLNNLMTKKGRTFLTAFAGAIGIIGIAAILALSNGVNDYISSIESEMMGSYPIELQKQTFDMSGMTQLQNDSIDQMVNKETHDNDKIYSQNLVATAVKSAQTMLIENNLRKFKLYLDENMDTISEQVAAVEYDYSITPQIFRKNGDEIIQISPSTLLESEATTINSSESYMSSMMSMSTTTGWSAIVSDQGLRESHYELLEGEWPSNYDEAALILSANNEVSDYVLYTLGLMDINEMNDMIDAIQNDEDYVQEVGKFEYSEAIGKEYKVFAPCEMYGKNTEKNIWINKTDDANHLNAIYDEGITVKITCVLRAQDGAEILSGVAYDKRLNEELLRVTAQSDIVLEQMENPDVNVLTGEAFEVDEEDESEDETDTVAEVENILYHAAVVAESRHTLAQAAETEPSIESADIMRQAESEPLTDGEQIVESESSTEGEQPVESESSTEGEETEESEPSTEETPEAAEGFKVTFINYDGTVLLEEKVYAPNEKITQTPTTIPERVGDENTRYIFVGWKSSTTDTVHSVLDLPEVTEDVVYMAVYYEFVFSADNAIDADKLQELLTQMDTNELMKWLEEIGVSDYIEDYVSELVQEQIQNIYGSIDWTSIIGSMSFELTEEQIEALLAQFSNTSPKTYEDVLAALAYGSLDEPSEIAIYPNSFDGKEAIEKLIDDYNAQVEDEDDQVTYTDVIGIITSSITEIIDTITYVLIAFVAISLVVSSIMIAIITYISVLERTKEIGVLRALGASKKDISKIFNAETFIEGLISGVFGIGTTLLLCIPINALVEEIVGVANIAVLPMRYALILILISVILTLIAGFVPARMAAKKDPVTALRSE